MSVLTADRLRDVLSYSPDSGMFTWNMKRGRAAAGSVAGSIHLYRHRTINVDGKGYSAHRLAWLHVHGQWPSEYIDHINGIRDDNRIANLRDASPMVNAQNRKGARKGKAVPFLGVRKATIGNQFTASITVDKKVIWLGGFDTPELAYAAYMAAKQTYHIGSMAELTATGKA